MKKLISIAIILILTALSMGMGVYENALTEVNVTAYGATANDSTDDTASIQKAINTGAATVVIPGGTYMINAVTSITPKSNQSIQMSTDTVLKAIPNPAPGYSIINIGNVTNVEITGGTVLGERYEHTGTTGEWGFGILISSNTDNITISNLTVKDCWGDGIYIGSQAKLAQNILIENVISDNNRRQGMTITYAKNVNIKNCTFKNTNGTCPEAGIDIEPNANCYVENVMIENSSFLDNEGTGIFLTGYNGLYVKNVKISNCLFSNNFNELVIESKVSDSGFTEALQTPSVTYQTHIQDIGWQGNVINGSVSGTSGQSKRLEAITIALDNLDGGIEYRTHVQDIGWMDWAADGAQSGTSGQSKRLEAIQIRLTGAAAETYDIYYRVHVQNTGWLDWAKNGESSGTAGFSYRLEAIQIVLVTKGETFSGSTSKAFIQATIPQSD